MDESFLSDAALIEASRLFVCIRLATYESAEEAEFLEKVYLGRGGVLANTVFGLLTPDASELLSRTGRSPQMLYRSPRQMAEAMDLISMAYPGNEGVAPSRLPEMKDFRLSLNVASCDGLPLVVAVSKDEEVLSNLNSALTSVAFSNELAGKFEYATTTQPDELSEIHGVKSEEGIYVIQPGTYGLDGTLIRKIETDTGAEDLLASLTEIAGATQRITKNHNAHVREGVRNGVKWETVIPVTDPDSIRAEERMRGRTEESGVDRNSEPNRSGR